MIRGDEVGDLMIGETIALDFGTVAVVRYNRGTERVASTPPDPPPPINLQLKVGLMA